MSIAPRGMSIQEAYRLYREGNLLVNRKYQRKLVWTVSEKEKLIGSILKEYPIPLVLLAERPQIHGSGKYEVIDGMQRLNAIFGFIENAFSFEEKYFKISEFSRARQLAEAGIFQTAAPSSAYLSDKECADLMDYQLAVTIYTAMEEDDITEVFGRINSGGKHLSSQEKRQAGITSHFAETVRDISTQLRGDVSKKVLLLTEMPEISIDSKKSSQGYKIQAEETLWCKQGALTVSQLRDSEDEQMVADICGSILFNKPLPVSTEYLDKLYDSCTKESKELEENLSVYSADRLIQDIIGTFSVMIETIEASNIEQNCLRKVVNPKNANPIKTAFYTVFMAFFDLIVCDELSPADPKGIVKALSNLQKNLNLSAHYTTIEDREKNIDQTKGLIQKFFVKKEPSALRHGAGLAKDFENSLRRSNLETPKYEFKQGLLRLDSDRKEDEGFFETLVKTICAIANVGPESDGYIFIGVADSEKDATRIREIDNTDPINVSGRYVVGIDREISIKKTSIEEYVRKIVNKIKVSDLSEPLKTQVLAKFDTILFKGKSVVRITVPSQSDVSFVGQKAFVRSNSSTIELQGPQLIAVYKLFSHPKLNNL